MYYGIYLPTIIWRDIYDGKTTKNLIILNNIFPFMPVAVNIKKKLVIGTCKEHWRLNIMQVEGGLIFGKENCWPSGSFCGF